MGNRRALTPEGEARALTLWKSRTPLTEIAATLKVHSNTIKRSVRRSLDATAAHDAEELQAIRSESITFYMHLQRLALQAADTALEKGRSPAMNLAEARQCQARIDLLLGLEQPQPQQVLDITFNIDRAGRPENMPW